jgi:hypothetical protein
MHTFFIALQVLAASFVALGTVLNVRKVFAHLNHPSLTVRQALLEYLRQSIFGFNTKGAPLKTIRTLALIVACWLIGAPIMAVVMTLNYIAQVGATLYLYLALSAMENFAAM